MPSETALQTLTELGVLPRNARNPIPLAKRHIAARESSNLDQTEHDVPDNSSYDLRHLTPASWLFVTTRQHLPRQLQVSHAEFELMWQTLRPNKRETITAYGKKVQLGREIRVFHYVEQQRDAGTKAELLQDESRSLTLKIGQGNQLKTEPAVAVTGAPDAAAVGVLQRLFSFFNERRKDEKSPRKYVYNVALVNFYETSTDSISYHSDKATGLQTEVPIVTLSLGPGRRLFRWKAAGRAAKGAAAKVGAAKAVGEGSKHPRDRSRSPRRGDAGETSSARLQRTSAQNEIWLEHGTLSVMGGCFQQEFVHAIPPLPKAKVPKTQLVWSQREGTPELDGASAGKTVDMRRISITLRAHLRK